MKSDLKKEHLRLDSKRIKQTVSLNKYSVESFLSNTVPNKPKTYQDGFRCFNIRAWCRMSLTNLGSNRIRVKSLKWQLVNYETEDSVGNLEVGFNNQN